MRRWRRAPSHGSPLSRSSSRPPSVAPAPPYRAPPCIFPCRTSPVTTFASPTSPLSLFPSLSRFNPSTTSKNEIEIVESIERILVGSAQLRGFGIGKVGGEGREIGVVVEWEATGSDEDAPFIVHGPELHTHLSGWRLIGGTHAQPFSEMDFGQGGQGSQSDLNRSVKSTTEMVTLSPSVVTQRIRFPIEFPSPSVIFHSDPHLFLLPPVRLLLLYTVTSSTSASNTLSLSSSPCPSPSN